MRSIISWALNILAPLVKTLHSNDGSNIYDPEGIIGTHKAFYNNGWRVQRRWGFNDCDEETRCAVLLSQRGELPKEAEALLKIGKPLAILIKESQYNAIMHDIQSLYGGEPALVHIHTKTDNQLCWLLVGFNSPANNMIAVTPHHYIIGLIDNETYEAAVERPKTGFAPPIFKLLSPEGVTKNVQCTKDTFEVRMMAEYISDIICHEKIEQKYKELLKNFNFFLNCFLNLNFQFNY